MLKKLTDLFEPWWAQDLLALVILGLWIAFIWKGSQLEHWQRAFRRLKRDWFGLAAGVVIALYLFIGLLETIRLPQGNGSVSLLGLMLKGIPIEDGYSAPMAKRLLAKDVPLHGWHLLGTNALGKDVFAETLRACRTALIIGGLTSVFYIPVGALLGVLAGYFRRRTDDIITYAYSVVASVPSILLLIAIVIVLGKSFLSMTFALAFTSWVGLCRLIRGETMRQAERQYVLAARALGQSHWKIVVNHLLPNVMHLVVISFVLGFGGLAMAEAILSYLGVGLPVGTSSWGAMIDGGRGELTRDPVVWWNLVSASTALFGLVLALNLFGDSLRRAFDPKRG